MLELLWSLAAGERGNGRHVRLYARELQQPLLATVDAARSWSRRGERCKRQGAAGRPSRPHRPNGQVPGKIREAALGAEYTELEPRRAPPRRLCGHPWAHIAIALSRVASQQAMTSPGGSLVLAEGLRGELVGALGSPRGAFMRPCAPLALLAPRASEHPAPCPNSRLELLTRQPQRTGRALPGARLPPWELRRAELRRRATRPVEAVGRARGRPKPARAASARCGAGRRSRCSSANIDLYAEGRNSSERPLPSPRPPVPHSSPPS